ncbi:hypothetical protein HPB48_010811 [Haemaphysalis longicornis]|uniref:Reverse transcriptase domain-containing protein n=1 Tax=Haemaphysalis longicornis TaxID=44386 RepID=A0A9J6FKU3_HAELO|nr:hypothetical protein HPB48_010811 [Haemaphysalis longicornis]
MRTLTLGPVESRAKDSSNRGTPQSFILSPLIFNIAMKKLPAPLNRIGDIKHAIYTDDITICTTKGPQHKSKKHFNNRLKR